MLQWNLKIFNKKSRDGQNMFPMLRFCYIKVFFICIYNAFLLLGWRILYITGRVHWAAIRGWEGHGHSSQQLIFYFHGSQKITQLTDRVVRHAIWKHPIESLLLTFFKFHGLKKFFFALTGHNKHIWFTVHRFSFFIITNHGK